MRRLLLIAEREFKAYATTASFWVALAMGPLLLAGAGLIANAAPGEPAPRRIAVATADPALLQAAELSLAEAAKLERRRFARVSPSEAPAAHISLARDTTGAPTIIIEAGRLSRIETALLGRDLALAGRSIEPVTPISTLPRHAGHAETEAKADRREPPFARFGLVFMVWMTLVGSLGMLLQAIVRERANRALETLMASAKPAEIVFGKLAGVGALAALVLAAWLGAGGLMAATPLGGGSGGATRALLAELGQPRLLAEAILAYVLAFGLYGAALVNLGALAKDLPSAQNLSRPVFGVLLIVFFVALATLMAPGQATGWLAWIPAFTPFVLLMDPGALSPLGKAAAVGLTLVSIAALARAAPSALAGPESWGRRAPIPAS